MVDDVRQAEWLAPDWTGYQCFGVRAMIIIPLFDHSELVGALFLHEREPRNWTINEVDLARSVADRTYAAIAKITAEEEQKILNQELVHRLKNTLAMTQSIARQTLRPSTDDRAFDAFSDRLVALGRAHEALIEQRWDGAETGTVVANIMKLHCSDGRSSLSGPDLMLGPRATLSLSMLLHELATNAVKYGALSTDSGRLTIAWQLEGVGDSANLVLRWTERGGPAVTEPARSGFGSRLIKLGLMGTGQTEKRYLPAGFEAEFRAPIARLRQG